MRIWMRRAPRNAFIAIGGSRTGSMMRAFATNIHTLFPLDAIGGQHLLFFFLVSGHNIVRCPYLLLSCDTKPRAATLDNGLILGGYETER